MGNHVCLLTHTDTPALFCGDTLFNAGAGNGHDGGQPKELYQKASSRVSAKTSPESSESLDALTVFVKLRASHRLVSGRASCASERNTHTPDHFRAAPRLVQQRAHGAVPTSIRVSPVSAVLLWWTTALRLPLLSVQRGDRLGQRRRLVRRRGSSCMPMTLVA